MKLRISFVLKCIASLSIFCGLSGIASATDYIYWNKKTVIPTAMGTSCITTTPGGDTIVVGTFDRGIYVSHDGGDTWQHTLSFVTDSPIYCIKHVGGRKIIAGSEGRVYVSDDNGMTWRNANISISYAVRDIVSVSTRIYICTGDYVSGVGYGDGVLVSANGGVTWTRVNTGLPLHESVWNLAADKIGRIYVSCLDATTGYGGLYYTTNSGSMWTQIPMNIDGAGAIFDAISITETYELAISPDDSLICSSDAVSGAVFTSGIYKNSIGGALAETKWNIAGLRPSATFWQRTPTRSLFFLDSNRVLGSNSGSTATGGPFFSADYGNTWQHMIDGLDVVGSGYNPSAYAAGPGTRIYMIQQGDNDLYYMDSIVHTPVATPLIAAINKVFLYPNPTSNVLHLVCEAADIVENISIISLDGSEKQCSVTKNNGNMATINHQLPAGCYFLRYSTRKGNSGTITFYVGQ